MIDDAFLLEFITASSTALRSAWAAVQRALQECSLQFFRAFRWCFRVNAAATFSISPHVFISD
jgi:hypothetical protein